jgi:hypothetical protein
MQEEYERNPLSTPRVIHKQSGYQYCKKSTVLKDIKSSSDNPSRQRMSCWWVLTSFLLFYAKFINKKYDPSLVINLDETSISQPKTINHLIAVPVTSEDAYVPEAPRQKGFKLILVKGFFFTYNFFCCSNVRLIVILIIYTTMFFF